MSDRSFYQWLMTQRKPENANEVEQFANNAFFDQSFPKHTKNYEEISSYLEENAGYLQTLSIFDKAFDEFREMEN